MKLYLVQHGDNLPQAVDPEKPLSPKGRRDIVELARACREHGISAVEVLHSGKTRAAQSAAILAEVLGLPVKASAGLDPLDPVKPFASLLENGAGDKVIVGHLPFMERLAALLVAEREEPPVVAFQRGGMLCLEKRERGWCIAWTEMPDQPRRRVSSEGGR